jgi:hypothetical protein
VSKRFGKKFLCFIMLLTHQIWLHITSSCFLS